VKTLRIILISLVALFILGCEKEPVSAVPEGMKLVWSDEFDIDGAPDKDKWTYSTGSHGWGNGESQNYTNKIENSKVEKGALVITARKEGNKWTSARVKTQHKADWTYGYFEIKAKLPEGVGTWPAIWMMPSFEKYGGWPRSGEIDIMEHVGFEQNVIHSSVHTQAFNHKIGTHKTNLDTFSRVSKKYHVYAMEWDPEYIQWFIDGELFYRFENTGIGPTEWPFDIPFYLIMNIAIGGGWGGQQGIDKKMKEAKMYVDYVRVYQKN